MTAPEPAPIRRGPLLITGALAAFGGAAIAAVTLPLLWRTWQLYALLFGLLAVVQLATVIILLRWPTRRTVLSGTAAAGVTLLVWLVDRVFDVLPAPDPWQPADTVLGIADYLAGGLQIVAVLALLVAASRGPRPQSSPIRWVVAWTVLLPVTVLVLVATGVGVTTASDGFTATGLPTSVVAPADLPGGTKSTVEYCRPAGIRLAMDIYTPAESARPAPVALYVHGGGMVLGNRKPDSSFANSAGALFPQLQRELNARGFVVASIDYRLGPAAQWPAQINDAKCAVRFLKAHASALHIDPNRIGVWGSSAGGTLASLLGTAGPAAGFDTGEYLGQNSAVRAVVDMFGPPDLTHVEGGDAIMRACVQLVFGSSADARRSGSPIVYVAPGAPPFLILQGEDYVQTQSPVFADRLRAAGVDVTYVQVRGTGHTLDTPTEQPSPAQLTARVVDFFSRKLA